jgi:hypothetical protein
MDLAVIDLPTTFPTKEKGSVKKMIGGVINSNLVFRRVPSAGSGQVLRQTSMVSPSTRLGINSSNHQDNWLGSDRRQLIILFGRMRWNVTKNEI